MTRRTVSKKEPAHYAEPEASYEADYGYYECGYVSFVLLYTLADGQHKP